MKVCEKVKKKGTTSYNEVADELVGEFTTSTLNSSLADQVIYEHIVISNYISRLDSYEMRKTGTRKFGKHFLTELQSLEVYPLKWILSNIFRTII